MNRGVLQSSPVQQMVAATGNPNWWSINNMMMMRPPTPQPSPFLTPPPTSFCSSALDPFSSSWLDPDQELSQTWSQLLLEGEGGGGLVVGGEDKSGLSHSVEAKELENWEEQQLLHKASNPLSAGETKQEKYSANSYVYCRGVVDHQYPSAEPTWAQMIMAPASSPNSCVTSLSSTNMLDLSSNKARRRNLPPPPPNQSSEYNSTATGGAVKKARVQTSSAQSTFKVKKEKLGDRITALHQLVSPFGKTDTASVILEAIGYIRFLQSQIKALSLPYLNSGSGNMGQQQHSIQWERNCLFSDNPGQLLKGNSKKRTRASDQGCHEELPQKDLRSRGLCLVPMSSTLIVGGDNGSDYWAPGLGGGL